MRRISCILLVTFCCLSTSKARELKGLNLTNTSYQDLHRVAVTDQVRFHQPAQKSLHTRQTQSLDGLFDFCLDRAELGFDQSWHSNNLEDRCSPQDLYRMPVPAAFNDITSNASVRNYVGWFWYQTTIGPFRSLEKADAAHRFIQFENVNYLSIVWLQPLDSTPEASQEPAQLLGSHVGGHLPFILNATEVINNPKLKLTNPRFRLTIAVSNKLTSETIPSAQMINMTEQVGFPYYQFKPDFDFFNFAGIMGSVELIELPPIFIDHVIAKPVESKKRKFIFYVLVNDKSLALQNWTRSLSAEVFDSQGNILKSRLKYDLQLVGDQTKLELEVESKMQRWTLANGNSNHFCRLATVRFQLELRDSNKSEVMRDILEIKVGFKRTKPMLIDPREGLKSRFGMLQQLQGFGMHHEQLFSGRHMSRAAIMKDIYLLKQMGANMIRTSHYPYSNDFLDACDENGILVIGECPAVGLNHFSDLKRMLHEQLLKEMMERDHHHPSIAMWSIANEPQSQLEPAKEYFEKVLSFARQTLANYTVEASRPLTAAIAQLPKDDLIGDLLDVVMINSYYGWYDFTGVLEAVRLPLMGRIIDWSNKCPNKPLIVSEFGADTLSGLHSSESDIFSEEFQRDLLVEHERVFDEIFASRNKSAINFWGSMIWNFADFSTHESLLRPGGNRKGLFTRDRKPKLASESIKQIYLQRLASASPKNATS